MADDLDIPELARYLHLDPAQVQKMADRGKIPGRKVGGVWHFPPGEIHHWLEERILGADLEERTRLEGVLAEEQTPAPDRTLTIAALLPPKAVEVPLLAKTKRSVILEMVAVAERTGWLWDPAAMESAVRQREDLMSTAVEGGAALLHPRRPRGSILGRAFLAMGLTPRGVPFGAPGGGLSDVFFLICSTDDATHLRTLARLGRIIGTPGVLQEIREASGAAAAREILVRCEETFDE